MVTFDPFDPDYRTDPYPVLSDIRATQPVLDTGLGFRLLTRYDDVLEVLTSPKFALANDAGTRRFSGEPAIARVCANAFLFQNAPSHTRLRSLTNRAFSPKRVSGLESRIFSEANLLLSSLPDEGELDLVACLAKPLPLAVVCDLVGIGPDDRERVGAMSEALCPTLEPVIPPDVVPSLDAAVSEFSDLVISEARRRDVDPRQDLLSTLWQATRRGEMTKDELVSSCVLVLAAGHATTENSISSAILHLLQNPSVLEQVRVDDSLVPMAYEESLRLESPIAVFLRWTNEPLEICGVPIEAGEAVAVHLGAANRDPDVFPSPDVYALDSRDTKHLAFGAGVHSCLGFALARAEAKAALRQVVRRFKWIELAEEPDWKPTVTVRGLKSLRVRYSSR